MGAGDANRNEAQKLGIDLHGADRGGPEDRDRCVRRNGPGEKREHDHEAAISKNILWFVT